MKPKLITATFAALFAAIIFTGCVPWTVKPGSDPIVVQAEQFAAEAASTLNTFISYVDRNRAVMGADAIAARDLAAKSGPIYIRELRRATKIYKGSRTTDNADQMNQRLAALRQLLETVRAEYAK